MIPKTTKYFVIFAVSSGCSLAQGCRQPVNSSREDNELSTYNITQSNTDDKYLHSCSKTRISTDLCTAVDRNNNGLGSLSSNHSDETIKNYSPESPPAEELQPQGQDLIDVSQTVRHLKPLPRHTLRSLDDSKLALDRKEDYCEIIGQGRSDSQSDCGSLGHELTDSQSDCEIIGLELKASEVNRFGTAHLKPSNVKPVENARQPNEVLCVPGRQVDDFQQEAYIIEVYYESDDETIVDAGYDQSEDATRGHDLDVDAEYDQSEDATRGHDLDIAQESQSECAKRGQDLDIAQGSQSEGATRGCDSQSVHLNESVLASNNQNEGEHKFDLINNNLRTLFLLETNTIAIRVILCTVVIPFTRVKNPFLMHMNQRLKLSFTDLASSLVVH